MTHQFLNSAFREYRWIWINLMWSTVWIKKNYRWWKNPGSAASIENFIRFGGAHVAAMPSGKKLKNWKFAAIKIFFTVIVFVRYGSSSLSWFSYKSNKFITHHFLFLSLYFINHDGNGVLTKLKHDFFYLEFLWLGTQLPWKPKGTRWGSCIFATGAAEKSWASMIRRWLASVLPS